MSEAALFWYDFVDRYERGKCNAPHDKAVWIPVVIAISEIELLPSGPLEPMLLPYQPRWRERAGYDVILPRLSSYFGKLRLSLTLVVKRIIGGMTTVIQPCKLT